MHKNHKVKLHDKINMIFYDKTMQKEAMTHQNSNRVRSVNVKITTVSNIHFVFASVMHSGPKTCLVLGRTLAVRLMRIVVP